MKLSIMAKILFCVFLGYQMIFEDVKSVAGEDLDALGEGLTVYATFDKGIVPEVIHGEFGVVKENKNTQWCKAPYQFEEGKSGGAIRIGKEYTPPGLIIDATDNMRSEAGAISLWVKASWLTNGVSDIRDIFSHPRMRLSYSGNKILLWAVIISQETGKVGAESYEIAKNPDWSSDEWHHIVWVWESPGGDIFAQVSGDTKAVATWHTRCALYVDGAKAGVKKIEATRLYGPKKGQYFALGGYVNQKGVQHVAEGSYDELGIWGRALTEAEVSLLYHGAKPPLEKIARKDIIEVLKTACDTPLFLYFDNESKTVEFDIAFKNKTEKDYQYFYQVLDFYEKEVFRFDNNKAVPAQGQIDEKLSYRPTKRGIFKIRLNLASNEKGVEHSRDILSFAVIPEDLSKRGKNANSPFGAYLVGDEDEMSLTLARKIGVAWQHTLGYNRATHWGTIEKTKGTFQWRDESMNRLFDHDFCVVGSIFREPKWAVSCPEGTSEWDAAYYPPKDMKDWENFVSRIAERYKGKINHWMVSDEASLGSTWQGTPEQFVEYQRVAYKALKKVSPENKLIGGGTVIIRDYKYFEAQLKAGLLDCIDILGVYNQTVPPPELRNKYPGMNGMQIVRTMMREYGQEKPLWGVGFHPATISFFSHVRPTFSDQISSADYRKAAYLVVKKFIRDTFAAGLERNFVYYARRTNAEWEKRHPITSDLFGAKEYSGLRPMGVAFATCAYLLGDAKFMKELVVNEDLTFYIFEDKGTKIVCYWLKTPDPDGYCRITDEDLVKMYLLRLKKVRARDRVTKVDIMANEEKLKGKISLPLSVEPVFLVVRGMNDEKLVRWLSEAEISGK